MICVSTSSTAEDRGAGRSAQQKPKGNIFVRMALFVRQVIDEMRKVVWPTRQELAQYTVVVLIFVVFVMLYIVGLDELFKRFVSWVFGAAG